MPAKKRQRVEVQEHRDEWVLPGQKLGMCSEYQGEHMPQSVTHENPVAVIHCLVPYVLVL